MLNKETYRLGLINRLARLENNGKDNLNIRNKIKRRLKKM